MGRNAKEPAARELIGLDVEIIDSANKSNVGISGRIIDETKETVVIKEDKSKKRLFKKNITLMVSKGSQKVALKGEDLQGRPKERTKTIIQG